MKVAMQPLEVFTSHLPLKAAGSQFGSFGCEIYSRGSPFGSALLRPGLPQAFLACSSAVEVPISAHTPWRLSLFGIKYHLISTIKILNSFVANSQ
jgi:hypothetical protein